MGNCSLTADQCSTLGDAPDIAVDADIVGIGVLVAFVISALLTFGIVIVSYLLNVVPIEDTNVLDEAFLHWFHSIKIIRLLKNAPSATSRVVRKVWRKPISRERHVQPPAPQSVTLAKRRKAMENLALSLSDQQLVTGLAILLAAYTAICAISIYEMWFLVSLAWFSSVTHLTTLDVLRTYFRRNTGAGKLRIIAMLVVLLLLLAGEVLTVISTVAWMPAPVQCLPSLLQYFSFKDLIANDSKFNDFAVIGYPIMVIAFLVFGFLSRILVLLSGYGISIHAAWLLDKLFSRVKSDSSTTSGGLKVQAYDYEFQNFIYERIALQAAKKSTHPLLTPFKRWWLTGKLYRRSFICKMVNLYFFLAYGMATIVNLRWYSGYEVDVQDGSMTFGQIVPLVLLILPAFTLVEFLYESEDDTTSDRGNSRSSGSSSAEPRGPPDERLQNFLQRCRLQMVTLMVLHFLLTSFIAVAPNTPQTNPDNTSYGAVDPSNMVDITCIGLPLILLCFGVAWETYELISNCVLFQMYRRRKRQSVEGDDNTLLDPKERQFPTIGVQIPNYTLSLGSARNSTYAKLGAHEDRDIPRSEDVVDMSRNLFAYEQQLPGWHGYGGQFSTTGGHLSEVQSLHHSVSGWG